MRKLISIIALSLVALVAQAQAAPTATVALNINWTPPTLNTDGSAITGALTYNLYQGPKAGPFVKVGNPITGTTTVVTSTTGGTCFEVTAVEALSPSGTAESLPVGPVCMIEPAAPGGASISVTVTIH
jgi:hypothetical protein